MKKCPGIIIPCGDGCPRAGYSLIAVQNADGFYDYESAFLTGTIFPALSLPQGKYGPGEIFS